MASSLSAPLPNPETPLAFLSPTLASQFEVSRYLLVATCGMFAWDILTNLRNDYKLLFKFRLSIPTLVYFVSRIAAFAYIITGTAFTIGVVGNCQALQVAIGCCFAVAVPATSLLFFFRVRAIFNRDKYVVGLFTCLWLATLGGSITVPFAINGGHIGPTNHCINTGVKPFSSAGVIIATVNDTLVFFFISWRLLQSPAIDESFRARVKSFFSGEGLPNFSKSVLQAGQEYYLITVGGNILTMSMILAPSSLPAVFHAMATVPNIAVGNAMACRVFRDIKFGRISSTHNTTIRNTSVPGFPAQAQLERKIPHQADIESAPDSMTVSGCDQTRIHYKKTVSQKSDIPMKLMEVFPPSTYNSRNSQEGSVECY